MYLLRIRYRLGKWLQLMRPHFLLASILFFTIGYLGANGPEVGNDAFLFGLASVVLGQLSCGLINEYSDWKGDRFAVRTAFSGGSGVLASGASAPSDALAVAIMVAGLSMACGWQVSAVLPARELFLITLIIAMGAGWALSVRPLRLINTGAGELMATVLIALVVPFLGSYLAGGELDPGLVPYLVPLALFTFAFLLAAEYPDRMPDIRSRKTNLAYRFGLRRVGTLMMLCAFAGYGAYAFLLITGQLEWWGWSLFILLPFVWAGGTVMGFAKHYDQTQATVTVWTMAVLLGAALSLTVVSLM